MSSAKPKRARQNKSRSHAGKKRYHPDRHRWRKVTATLLSILFFVPFSLCFYAHGAWFVWSVVASIAILLWLAIVLFEWHVWKRTFVLGRLALLVACSALVIGGVKWQSRIQLPIPRRAWLRFTEEQRGKFIALLASQTEPRDRVRLACPASNEEVCVLAAPFVGDFQRGHFFVENAGIARITLGRPSSGTLNIWTRRCF